MEKLCPACEMPFEWPGETADGQEFCCDGCAGGTGCTCPEHDHRSERAAAPSDVE